jgi:protein-S-isoprenylcysteine O-methyltransferase Ste14
MRLEDWSWIELAALWMAWAYPYAFRAPHVQKRQSITVVGPTRIGLALETASVVMALLPRAANPRTSVLALLAAGVVGGIGAVLAWTAVQHLGKQFRVHAGLYVDHELISTGPYSLVRHPIYASVLALLLATIILRTGWPMALAALSVFVIGTEIRVKSEEKLLASRFGPKFLAYKKKVFAYVPFIR